MARWLVREIAERKGFETPYRLALESKLPLSSVQGIWKGTAKRADLETLSKLAVALGVRPGDLIGNGEVIQEGNSLPTRLTWVGT